ncbi:MAG: chromosomal replication initiator protein DnaA [Armatimonadetes bacterium]|nr:chromosomal replication initiator protein DnaA [Armatimonadota bacterium]
MANQGLDRTDASSGGNGITSEQWTDCLAVLQKELPGFSYGICLRDSRARVAAPGHLEVVVSLPYAATLARERTEVAAAVRRVLAEITGRAWSVEWIVNEEARESTAAERNVPADVPAAARRKRANVGRMNPDFVHAAAREAVSANGPLDERHTFDNFVTGPTNELAVQAAKKVAHAPATGFNPLIIYGDVGLGKTHLMMAVEHRVLSANPRARVHYVGAEQFKNEYAEAVENRRTANFRKKYRQLHYLLIDDIQFLINKPGTQQELCNTFEELMRRGCQIVLTSDKPPKLLTEIQERLCSRLSSGLIADVGRPTRDMCLDILRLRARESHAMVSHEALSYISENFSSSVRQLEGALVRVLAMAEASRNSSVDLCLVRHALQGLRASTPTTALTMDNILEKVAGYFHISLEDLTGKRRDRKYSTPRHVAMFLAYKVASQSVNAIGEAFGGKDYSSVRHAIDRVDGLRSDASMRVDLRALCGLLGRDNALG